MHLAPPKILQFQRCDMKHFQSLKDSNPSLLQSYFLVVRVVGEVIKVMFDSHEHAREAPAAPQLGGKDHTRDQVVSSWVGRWDSPQ